MSKDEDYQRKIARKAIREGYILVMDFLHILVADPSYSNILPILIDEYFPNHRSFRGFERLDPTTREGRAMCWMNLIQRWGGMQINEVKNKSLKPVFAIIAGTATPSLYLLIIPRT